LANRPSALVACVAILSSCVPFDLFGEEEIVRQHDEGAAPPAITDDRIEDKHPVLDPTLTIQEPFGSCTVTLNKSASVTKLDVVPSDGGNADSPDVERLYGGYAAAAAALSGRPLLPTMEVVNGWLKPFDDGLYAAVELHAQGGVDSAIDKRAVLRDLLATLIERTTAGTVVERPLAYEAATHIAAASKLGGASPIAPADVLVAADGLIAKFDGQPVVSRPLGFYGWTPMLGAIYRQDRFLQSSAVVPSFGAFAATASALSGVPDVAARYGAVLDLYSGLTNPFFHRSVRDLMPLVPTSSALADLPSLETAFHSSFPTTSSSLPPSCRAHLAFVPSSDDASNRLFRGLFCNASIPAGTNLIDVLIARIRSGAIDLTPTDKSGWSDRQLYALETLLLPERAPEKDHLFLTRRYKEKLVETFKTILVENRETHVKELETVGGGSVSAQVEPIPVDVYPQLPVEPFPTFYLRTARAYRFVETLLEALMGPTFLSRSRRVLEGGGEADEPLANELHERIARLYGLHAIAAASIGMRPQLSAEEAADYPIEKDVATARAWIDGWAQDPDVRRDPRVIVPIFVDHDRKQIRYWAVVGVRAIEVEARFYPDHEPQVLSPGAYCVFRSFVSRRSVAFIGKTIELSLPASTPPPTRDEFRAICDRSRTAADVVAALGGT
jgi:hypothetical protein